MPQTPPLASSAAVQPGLARHNLPKDQALPDFMKREMHTGMAGSMQFQVPGHLLECEWQERSLLPNILLTNRLFSYHSMGRSSFHFLVTLMCVLSIAFQAVAGGLLVQCNEADGSSHLEWGGCGRDENGRCAKPCGPQSPDDSESQTQQNPCEDKPVTTDVVSSTVRSATSSITVDLPLPVFAVVAFPNTPLPLNIPVQRIEVRATAPPPSIASIRTIVMLV